MYWLLFLLTMDSWVIDLSKFILKMWAVPSDCVLISVSLPELKFKQLMTTEKGLIYGEVVMAIFVNGYAFRFYHHHWSSIIELLEDCGYTQVERLPHPARSWKPYWENDCDLNESTMWHKKGIRIPKLHTAVSYEQWLNWSGLLRVPCYSGWISWGILSLWFG